MNVLALVCARGGSKGLPGKNLRPLGGRPLVAWAIEKSLTAKGVDRVMVSTDSDEIAAVARAAGADVPFLRPAELSLDASPEWLVWRHAMDFVKKNGGALPDCLLVVSPTAPLRSVDDLNRCVAEFEKGGADIVVTVTEAHRNPYFNMVKLGEDGTVTLVIPPEGQVRRRQDAPQVFDMTTVAYASNPEFVMTHEGMFEGRVRHVEVPVERALDIDTPFDFRIAEFLLPSQGADR